MKQFQFAYTDDESFLRELEKIEQWRRDNAARVSLWRIYSIETDVERIEYICDILNQKMPDALYLGCSTSGNISAGALAAANTILTCTVFEHETTRVELLQFPFTEENVSEAVGALKAYCGANPWVRCVELHATMMGMSVQGFCDEMSTLPEDIQVFGGGACNADPYYTTTYVFSNAGRASGHGAMFSNHGIVFLLLGGNDFHSYSTYICGWKPLKRRFTITRANRQLLYELDGEPAFNIYKRFLSVEKGDDFINSTTEFPLMMISDGVEILRNPLVVNDDDTIVMVTDIQEGTDIRLAYGDPQTILNSILHDGQNIADFRPDAIQTFSCAARRVFWGDENVSDETALFHSVAPTSGFFSCSEFLRVGGTLRCFNMTLVFAAMREGEPSDAGAVHAFAENFRNTDSERMSLIRRFVSFIEASTAEFEALNRKLIITSITDGLTGLYNRAEIEKRIRATVNHRAQDGAPDKLSLIMLDIDNFKRINDVYGHAEGDRVIIALADTLRKVLGERDGASFGRWGGEEFMALLPDADVQSATELAEEICREFAAVSYETAGPQTVSIGVIQARDGENADSFCNRVDKALYMAKANGKNQVIQLD